MVHAKGQCPYWAVPCRGAIQMSDRPENYLVSFVLPLFNENSAILELVEHIDANYRTKGRTKTFE